MKSQCFYPPQFFS